MKAIDYLEVHWWIKDSTKRGYIRGVDKITASHLQDLKADSFESLDKDHLNVIIADFGFGCETCASGLTADDVAFYEFNGTLLDVADEPIDFGVNKVKKIYKNIQ